jgi:cysteine desulfuration protein SufE
MNRASAPIAQRAKPSRPMTTAATIAEKQAKIVADYAELGDWEERYGRIIAEGKTLSALPDEHRVDKNLIKGCLNRAWLHAEFRDGVVEYVADSESTIVRGLIALTLRVYSGHTPDEILAAEPEFVSKLGLAENLSQNRQNGLQSFLKQVKLYAFALKRLHASESG